MDSVVSASRMTAVAGPAETDEKHRRFGKRCRDPREEDVLISRFRKVGMKWNGSKWGQDIHEHVKTAFPGGGQEAE